MRFMMIVKSVPAFEAEPTPVPDEKMFAAMGAYNEALAAAGVLLDAAGLHPTRRGWRIQYGAGKPVVVDGPFAESKELVAGYTLIQVRSRDEALEWSRRFPNPVGEGMEAQIEVRQLYELEDFADSPSMQRLRDLGFQ